MFCEKCDEKKYENCQKCEPTVRVDIEGSPKQVNDIVETIRKRIKAEQRENKESWEFIWRYWEET